MPTIRSALPACASCRKASDRHPGLYLEDKETRSLSLSRRAATRGACAPCRAFVGTRRGREQVRSAAGQTHGRSEAGQPQQGNRHRRIHARAPFAGRGPCSPATTRPTSSALPSSTAWEAVGEGGQGAPRRYRLKDIAAVRLWLAAPMSYVVRSEGALTCAISTSR